MLCSSQNGKLEGTVNLKIENALAVRADECLQRHLIMI